MVEAPPSLESILLRAHLCSRAQIEGALQNQVIMGGSLGTNLLEMGALTEADLARALAHLHGLPSLHGSRIEPEAQALALLPGSKADKLNLLPFRLLGRDLEVLCVDPLDIGALDEVAFATGKRPRPIVISELRLWQLLSRFHGIRKSLRGLALPPDSFENRPPQNLQAPDRNSCPEPTVEADLISEEDFARYYHQPVAGADLHDGLPTLDAADLEPWESEPTALDLPMLSPSDLEPVAPGPVTVDSLTPLGFDEALQHMQNASDRDAVARIVIRYARTLFRRVLLLTVHNHLAIGWEGAGRGLSAEGIRSLAIRLDRKSAFQIVVETRAHYLGSLTRTHANIRFLGQTGRELPRSVFLLPVLVGGRVVNLLYADNGHRRHAPHDIGDLLVLAQHISRAYEDMIQQRMG